MEGFLNPNQVLDKLSLKDDMVAADFGCGSGGWVIPLAKRLSSGLVYAVDILEEPLSALRVKANLAKLTNIEIMKADIEKGTKVIRESCDLVLATNLLFQCENKKGVLNESKSVLKPGGRILVVDWKTSASLGPPGKRVSPDEVKKLASELNLPTEQEFEAGPFHYGLVLVK